MLRTVVALGVLFVFLVYLYNIRDNIMFFLEKKREEVKKPKKSPRNAVRVQSIEDVSEECVV